MAGDLRDGMTGERNGGGLCRDVWIACENDEVMELRGTNGGNAARTRKVHRTFSRKADIASVQGL